MASMDNSPVLGCSSPMPLWGDLGIVDGGQGGGSGGGLGALRAHGRLRGPLALLEGLGPETTAVAAVATKQEGE